MVPSSGSGLTTIQEAKKRSQEQNRKMWSVLTQLCPIDWYGQKLSKDDWHDVITAGLKRSRIVPGIEGGFVVLGASTREMSTQEMSDVIEYALWFGNSKGIRFVER